MSNEESVPEKAQKITSPQICLTTPLYSELDVEENLQALHVLRFKFIQFDTYCTYCKRSSTFRTGRPRTAHEPALSIVGHPGTFEAHLICQRNNNHVYVYIFYANNLKITKIGQHPSLEDIAGSDIQRFRQVLKPVDFSELHRAGGLLSHGIGIGAFVYLRRIFERLIGQHYEDFLKTGKEIENFNGLRMDEKIESLNSVLPPAIVKYRSAYSILSKGLHELDEETCRLHFPVIRAVIIMILEQDLEAKRRQLLEAQLDKDMQAISAALKGRTPS